MSANAEVSTLELFGGIRYDSTGGLAFPARFVPESYSPAGVRFKMHDTPGVLTQLNANAPYYGIMAIDYALTLDLPVWTQKSNWEASLVGGVEVFYKLGNGDSGSFKEGISTPVSLPVGTFSLFDVLGPEAGVNDFISNVAMPYLAPGFNDYSPDGGYYIDGNWASGQIYGYMEQDFLQDIFQNDLERAQVKFGGILELTATPIPTPTSLMLVGMGLVSLMRRRRKS